MTSQHISSSGAGVGRSLCIDTNGMRQRSDRPTTRRRASASLQRRDLLLLLFLLLPGSCTASTQAPRHLGHQAWTTEDGLPQNSVHQVLQTHDGYLWVATEGGLARFDGISFTVFRHEEQPTLPSDDIACLAEDTQGTLWIGTTDGLARFAAGQFSAVALGSLAGPPSVLALAAGDDGSMLALTASGLVRLQGGHADPMPGAPATVETLTAAPDGTAWLTSGSHLLRYTNGRLLAYGDLAPGPPPLELQIVSSNAIWLRSADGILTQTSDRRRLSPSGLAAISLPNTFLVDTQGDLWVGTKHGLFVTSLPAGKPVRIEAIGDRSVLSLKEDREGDLWVGTEADGLHILRPQKIGQITGLGDSLLTALTQTSDGTVWIGTRDDGLRVVQPRPTESPATARAQLPHLTTPLTSQVVLSLAAGRKGDLWVGTLDGLDHIEHGSVERYSSADGLPDDGIRSLLVDDDDTLWIGTRRGLVHWRGVRGAPFDRVSGLPSDLIGAMLRSRTPAAPSASDHALWVATLDGLTRMDGDVHHPTLHSDKLDPGTPDDVITSIAEDAAGTLWVGTRRNGLAALTASGLHSLSYAALPRSISSLLVDRHSQLWMGTSQGIFRVATDQIKRCIVDQSCAPSIARFGYADGMPTEETTASGHPAALLAADGTLWFATTKGAVTINPATLRAGAAPPPIVIERFLLDNQSEPLSASPIRLPFGHRSVAIDYAGLSFAAPSRVRYRYLLDGFEKQWTEAGSRRTAFYTNLPPGRYLFKVQAAGSDGLWNGTGADLAFTILPPFYRRVWFYLLLILALASLAYAIYYLRIRHLRSQFDAVLAERSRIAREIHDTLAQNFVGISIQLQIAEQLLSLNDTAAIGEQLRQTRTLVQEGLNDARQSIWELRASVAQDSLPTRISRAVERSAHTGTTQRVHIGGIYRPLDAALEKEVLRITQEALANVSRHAHATDVNVELRYEADRLHLAIVDNGTGFDPDTISANGDHFGLQGMRERAASLRATLSLTSSPGAGTAVHLAVPLPKPERRP